MPARTLSLQPGRLASIVRSPRPDLAALLALGQPAAQLPARMAGLHALCAHGHHAAAHLAVQAARGETPHWSGTDRQALQHAVAREQVLRIAHDWPRLLPGVPKQPPLLQGCPLWDTTRSITQQLQALPTWLQQHWLQRPVATLSRALADDPVAAALAWARSTPTPTATLLAAVLPRALQLRTAHRPLRGTLQPPCHDLPDTGPWNRRHDRQAPAADNAGMRLIARLQDLLHLAQPEGQDWLHTQATSLGDGVGSAQVEVGRGCLSYRVQLDRDARVQKLQLLSPTDWNFHPAGVLAQALVEVQDVDDARLLAVAFDPCEPFELLQPEPVHA